ncbi:hypothetical protein KIN20_010533 [Parelaphostrongylus tenuis]|uniref:Uncharacterized protein n=1 Tax=Parelaphostrongylus tenuis TaxID=148309 RepID=A0AAD5MTI5_PARTN|nr:hypothetical protein KIN20_010533 [Parelaphostrongylus tenuis]
MKPRAFELESILRSRTPKKANWTDKEFMCLVFRVGIDSSDGPPTYELPSKPFLKDLPYHKLKGRFPTALFEYFEKRMPSPLI